jgi:hypothetical protein
VILLAFTKTDQRSTPLQLTPVGSTATPSSERQPRTHPAVTEWDSPWQPGLARMARSWAGQNGHAEHRGRAPAAARNQTAGVRLGNRLSAT